MKRGANRRGGGAKKIIYGNLIKLSLEIVNCCLKETKHNDESLAGKSPKNLAEFESYACMEKKLKTRAVSSMATALLLIFSLLKWDGEKGYETVVWFI